MDELLALLRETLDVGDDIDANTPLLSSGLIDSFDVVNLIGVLEAHYDIQVDPMEIDSVHFDTPTQILEMLRGGTRG